MVHDEEMNETRQMPINVVAARRSGNIEAKDQFMNDGRLHPGGYYQHVSG